MTFVLKNKETQVGFLYDLSSLIKRFVRTPRLSFFVRWIAGVALASLILLIAVLPLVGVLLGLCGGSEKVKPTERGCASNCGGILLMRWVWTVCSCVMAVPDCVQQCHGSARLTKKEPKLTFRELQNFTSLKSRRKAAKMRSHKSLGIIFTHG